MRSYDAVSIHGTQGSTNIVKVTLKQLLSKRIILYCADI